MSDESNITKDFDAILEDIKNNGRTAKSISLKSCGSNINLHPLIIKLPNTEKMVLKIDSEFDEAFNIFDEIDNKRNKLYNYKRRSSNKINTKKYNARVLENYRK